MFARFRNLFSKNKSEMDAEDNTEPNTEAGAVPVAVAVTVTENANGLSEQNVAYVSSVDQSKLEGLNLIKSLVATEQQILKAHGNFNETVANGSTSTLTQEIEEILSKKLLSENGNESENILNSSEENKNSFEVKQEYEINSLAAENVVNNLENEISELQTQSSNKKGVEIHETSSVLNKTNETAEINRETFENITSISLQPNCNDNETLNQFKNDSVCVNNSAKTLQSNTNKTELVPGAETETELNSNDSFVVHKELPAKCVQSELNETATVSKTETESDSVSDLLKKMRTEVMTLNYLTKETSPLPLDQEVTVYTETDPQPISEICKTSIIKSWVQENNANFTPPTPYPLLSTESAIKLDTHSSIVVEDLPSGVTTPSPTVDGSISGGSSNTSTMDSTAARLAADPTKIVVNPIGDNGLACNAITGKLTDIAEVAESLDTVIRDIQENSQSAEVESNPSPRDKKMGTMRSTSSEDWNSRSTEDESFVTASEGRTSSFMSCNKSSCDYSEEGDDSTVNFEMPDVNSPFNMSFDESEQSYRSPHHENNKTPTKLSENGDTPVGDPEVPAGNLADLEDEHSESVTPTPPAENVQYYVESIPIESETELEVAAIANAPHTTNVLTESVAVPISVTPEVSKCSNHFDKKSMLEDNATPLGNGQHASNTTNINKPPPNVAWRRSKYYENITKQTIKGFL